MMAARILTIAAVLLAARPATAGRPIPGPAPPAAPAAPDPNGSGLHLELPLVDLPFNAVFGFTAPSMQQSLWITTDVYNAVHYGLGRLVDPYDRKWYWRILGIAIASAADGLLMGFPFFSGWEHEEWHRAVMSNRRVASFNEVYDFRPFASTVSVSQEADANLARLKASYPAEFVRLMEAGMEGEYELATNLEKSQFYNRTRTYNGTLVAILYLVNTLYMYTCTQVAPKDVVQPASVAKRDFTGPDCTGWAYHIDRPNEPYAAQGRDRSGVGVQRYHAYAGLTGSEQRLISTHAALSLLNFLDPNIASFNAFTVRGPPGGRDIRLNFNVRHELTVFGSDTQLNVFFERAPLRLFGTVHGYFNQSHFFPGVSAELIRWPLRISDIFAPDLSLRGEVWLQPKDQRHDTGSPAPGALAALRLGHRVFRVLEPYIEWQAKSAGWVAGEVSLVPKASMRLGVSATLLQ